MQTVCVFFLGRQYSKVINFRTIDSNSNFHTTNTQVLMFIFAIIGMRMFSYRLYGVYVCARVACVRV